MTDLFAIEGKAVLVTGGAHGLGRMMAEGFVRAGCSVYITSRSAELGDAAAREMSALGRCVALSADLSTPTAAVVLAEEMKQRENGLHVLVNNAGKSWGSPLESFPDNAWDSVMAINVQTPFTLIRELLPLLAAVGTEVDPARVINVGSAAGSVVERINAYSYCASKAAIHHLSRVVAAELADRHITVNAIVPGYFPTEMTAFIRSNPDLMGKLLPRIPLRRLGTPEDLAGICVFLASRAGAYVTGAQLPLDGGLATCR